MAIIIHPQALWQFLPVVHVSAMPLILRAWARWSTRNISKNIEKHHETYKALRESPGANDAQPAR